jgi:hypothetical protein
MHDRGKRVGAPVSALVAAVAGVVSLATPFSISSESPTHSMAAAALEDGLAVSVRACAWRAECDPRARLALAALSTAIATVLAGSCTATRSRPVAGAAVATFSLALGAAFWTLAVIYAEQLGVALLALAIGWLAMVIAYVLRRLDEDLPEGRGDRSS